MLFANLGPIEVNNLLNSSTMSLSCVTFFPWSTRIKRGYMPFEEPAKSIFYTIYIRVLPDRVKRGYMPFTEPKSIFYTISAFYPIG
jgi:hypothetical protein